MCQLCKVTLPSSIRTVSFLNVSFQNRRSLFRPIRMRLSNGVYLGFNVTFNTVQVILQGTAQLGAYLISCRLPGGLSGLMWLNLQTQGLTPNKAGPDWPGIPLYTIHSRSSLTPLGLTLLEGGLFGLMWLFILIGFLPFRFRLNRWYSCF